MDIVITKRNKKLYVPLLIDSEASDRQIGQMVRYAYDEIERMEGKKDVLEKYQDKIRELGKGRNIGFTDEILPLLVELIEEIHEQK